MADNARTPIWVVLLPLAFFAALAVIFYIQLGRGDTSDLPSALLDKPAPETMATPIEGSDFLGFDNTALIGQVSLVNVWASWCGPCRAEHPLLTELAKEGEVPIFGINFKDKPDQATQFLAELGNPYQGINADPNGRASVDWGIFGVPETFVIDPNGNITYRHAGPLTPSLFETIIRPEIAKARQ